MIAIERLTEASAEALADINKLLPQIRSNPEDQHASFEELKSITDDQNAMMFVARDDDRIVGMATLYAVTRIGRHGYVEDVVVDNAYRGQGLGKKLMHALIDYAREHGFKQVYLTTNPSRVAAHGLYQSLGFKIKETDVFKLVI